MLSDDERKSIALNPTNAFAHGVDALSFARDIERAVLAKASQQVQDDARAACDAYIESLGGSESSAWHDAPVDGVFIAGFEAGRRASPAPKQEPVGWNAQCSCGHKWVMDLPTENCPKCNPAPPQAAAIPDRKND